jgi:hypothetical protein
MSYVPFRRATSFEKPSPSFIIYLKTGNAIAVNFFHITMLKYAPSVIEFDLTSRERITIVGFELQELFKYLAYHDISEITEANKAFNVKSFNSCFIEKIVLS